MAIKLGSKVRDIYSGVEGLAVARTVWLYGCARIGIESGELKDGLAQDAQWFDEQRVETVEDEMPRVSSENSAPTGGPQRDPSR